ncbi:hypothetical protein LTR91_016871 [Friedmanniomyces endolithicus]|uniref:Uncharacterized protein n=1 Tax=Friedmanniomyces endolithicus TaxID=329885 RepID=A0AAN6K7B0_9PEZI|nr:hypothetical protein LTR94_009413 [Friedmanniomyces endolithicus]KAK0771677.1 hypothetical protein LTR59_015978 [Friedmanniomyces endolithicus]KAK0818569.1 hypothetical protein LTR38_001151 [Friedmanniomyces endolithicus]KAK0821103.1 hypothetical protein LTR75_001173 [Friedmanniomyces endolithicus]KAK0864647.1 hypothetical protein LTS02_005880 [Friedmanniomyces endolithicus]
MAPTTYTTRTIPRISLANFPTRINDITAQLLHAAETDGFVSLTDTEISLPTLTAISSTSQSFSAFPNAIKFHRTLHARKRRAGKPRSRIRPSTGVADQRRKKATNSNPAQTCQQANGTSSTTLPDFKPSAQPFKRKPQSLS